MKREKKWEQQGVTPLQNDFTRAAEIEGARKKAHHIRLYRRLTVFGLIILLTSIWLGSTIYAQSQTIAGKEQQHEEKLVQLEVVEKQQNKLEEQIRLLNDDDYLSKLARKDYFLSDEGEIIFTMPNDAGKSAEDGKK
ncbi:septum formation initiator family protein [Planococcus sp. ISL-109]|uniref:FtsB family cell division protein n=1 Tax=Planococcus sp. ISL-109 TaxID=2819166 RepID=UPI001BEA684D|nr:septum formation initiator family protein [Planococcus sp. ISL-109]MBT2583847.1 septum formation initiator family protein [Planococcus sp. ISL-109]